MSIKIISSFLHIFCHSFNQCLGLLTPFNVILSLSDLPFGLTFLGSGSGDGVGRWWIGSEWNIFKDVLCSLLTGKLLSASYANIE